MFPILKFNIVPGWTAHNHMTYECDQIQLHLLMSPRMLLNTFRIVKGCDYLLVERFLYYYGCQYAFKRRNCLGFGEG